MNVNDVNVPEGNTAYNQLFQSKNLRHLPSQHDKNSREYNQYFFTGSVLTMDVVFLKYVYRI